jgi:hypothetical protein
MSYTFATKNTPVDPNEESNMGSLQTDANHNAMTGVVGSGPQMTDATGTPQKSPLTVATNAVTTLVVPVNAAKVTFQAATNTVNVSESDATVATKYFTLSTASAVTIDVARCSTLYLEANSGSSTLSFFFTVV